LREEAVMSVEVVIEHRHGSATPAELGAAPVRSESGVQLGAVMVFQDMSTLKLLQHLRRDFTALVARDPLQSVFLLLEAISQQPDRLVRDLLDASRAGQPT
jgi:signal transduction histidine kinase